MQPEDEEYKMVLIHAKIDILNVELCNFILLCPGEDIEARANIVGNMAALLCPLKQKSHAGTTAHDRNLN